MNCAATDPGMFTQWQAKPIQVLPEFQGQFVPGSQENREGEEPGTLCYSLICLRFFCFHACGITSVFKNNSGWDLFYLLNKKMMLDQL